MPSLLIDGAEKSLVVTDLHLGFEGNLSQNNIFLGKNTTVTESVKEIEKILEKTKSDSLILLGDVKSGIKRSLIRDEKKSFAKSYLTENSVGNADWKSLADSDDFIEFVEADTKTIGGTFTTIGKSGELTGTLLAMNADDVSPVLTTFNTACIVKMTSKDEFDEGAYDEAFTDLKTQLNNTKSSRGYGNWLRVAKENIEIIDNRSSFY